MICFSLFDARTQVERDKWLEAWRSWPNREVSAHPDYVTLFARASDRPLCVLFEDENGTVLFPIILRPLAVESWAQESVFFDAVTPYGYGGPFSWGTPDVAAFWRLFDEWAENNGVVSMFARLSLFPEQQITFAGEVEVKAPNVVRRLTLDAEALWYAYEHKVRKNVNKARREGVVVEIDCNGTRLAEFLDVYYKTMDRREATSGYYFPPAFFNTMVEKLPDQFSFFHAVHEGKVVSTELVLVSADHVYSFLGGTLPEAFHLRANDLLKHEIIEWGREQGKQTFVLGGGYNGPDGIFRYKLSFAPDGEVPFRVGKRIYSQSAYNSLVVLRQQSAPGAEERSRSGFFPAYRA